MKQDTSNISRVQKSTRSIHLATPSNSPMTANFSRWDWLWLDSSVHLNLRLAFWYLVSKLVRNSVRKKKKIRLQRE